MTVPFSINEQMGHNWFQPKYRLAVLFGMSKFDAVLKLNSKGNLVQAIAPLPDAKKDCDNFKECLKKYQIRGEDVIDLSNNPTPDEVDETFSKLSRKLSAGKTQHVRGGNNFWSNSRGSRIWSGVAGPDTNGSGPYWTSSIG